MDDKEQDGEEAIELNEIPDDPIIVKSETNIVKDDEQPETSDPAQEVDEATNVKPKERTKPRVPSALTVENVKKHEEETDAIDVVELMTKNVTQDEHHLDEEIEKREQTLTPDEAVETKEDEFANEKPLPPISKSTYGTDDEEEPLDYPEEDRSATPLDQKMAKKKDEAEKILSDIWTQPKKQTMDPIVSKSPAFREEVRGMRFTGEEYLAVSIDVQTDESYFTEMFEWPQNNLGQDFSPFASHPSRATAASDGLQPFAMDGKRQRKHVTSDLSSAGIIDEDSVLHITHSSGTSDQRGKDHSVVAESDTEEDNPVTEITESEYGGSEALTHTTMGTGHTIPSVGPPFILQYKAESEMIPIDYDDIDVTMPEDLRWEDMTSEQRTYYQNMMEEMKRLRKEKIESENPEKDLINIEPHSAYGSRRDRKLAKDREQERLQMREMEKQSKQTSGGQMMANQTNFYAFARQLKTVNYSLSSEKCMDEGWTVRPVTPTTPEELAKEIFIHDPNDDILTGKRFKHMFVRKLYPNGQLFLTVFPDGTGNVWYPSGNVAVSIIASEKIGKLIFILHEDVHPTEEPCIQAIFEPTGNCTCYYPSGVVRLLLTAIGGEYFSPIGERLKKWIWKDTQTHVHAPPFQPITFALSRKVGVRVMSQESIYITFTDGRRSVRFNAGTRLRLRPALLLPKLEKIDEDQLILDEKRSYVQTILERINNSVRFPNSPRLKKIHLPNYLTAQIDKTAKLKARLLEQQMLENPVVKKKSKKKSSSRYKSSAYSSSGTEVIPPVQAMPKQRRAYFYSKKKEIKDEVKPVVIVN